MKNLLEILKQYVRHNKAMIVSAGLALIFSIWFFGCQSQTRSLLDPALKVTEAMLQVEYTSELARLETELQTLQTTAVSRMQDLHRQDKFKQALFENAKLIAVGGNPNPLGMLSLVGTLFGIGAVIDNRTKDGIIKGLKSGND